MKRPALLLLGIVAIALAAYASYRSLASDETRIRWLLEGAARSFNDAHLGGCLEAFDESYRDTSTTPTLEHATLASALRHVFLQRVDGKTRAFLLRVRIPEEALTIRLEAGQQAEATFELDLDEHRRGAWQPAWQLEVTAQLRKAGGNWLIQRSSHQTTAGKPPW